jgi:hypothetical protein
MSAFEYIAYKVEPLDKEQTILKLERFREIDKYRSFYKILPAVVNTLEHERELVTAILETSCKELIILFKAEKKAHKASIKKVINDCMKMIAAAQVSNTNKDFAYEMCWYLSDIAGLDMRRASATSSWGYWDIILNEVKVVQQKAIPPRKKKDKGLQ